jgi:hypothetical protein
MEEINADSNLEESDTIELENILLNRTWSFWENYETKRKSDLNYTDSLKEIYTFNDIISFWQFWNKYPGRDTKAIFYNGEYVKYFFKEKYRIIAMNIFEKGIRPEWEDNKNKKGNILTLGYTADNDMDRFLSIITDSWIKLICFLLGETIPYSNNINGIRFVDKSNISYNKSIIFKFEVWVNSSMKEKELEEIKKLLTKEFGCSGTIKPIK